jgi:hypothetical protein
MLKPASSVNFDDDDVIDCVCGNDDDIFGSNVSNGEVDIGSLVESFGGLLVYSLTRNYS